MRGLGAVRGKVYRDSSVGENMRARVQVKARWALRPACHPTETRDEIPSKVAC